MYVNKNDIAKLNGELKFVVEALSKDETVWEYSDPRDGWVKTQQINIFKSAQEYHVGDNEPQ